MRPMLRVLIGACVGALLVLILHPATSRFYKGAFWNPGGSAVLRSTFLNPSNVHSAPEPTTPVLAAYWMLLATEQDARGKTVPANDLRLLSALCHNRAAQEPENAFWKQMQAWILLELGRSDDALKEWRRASNCSRWNDLQGARLQAIANELRHESGGILGWHQAALYHLRSTAIAQAIREAARSFWFASDDRTPEGLLVRASIVQNGRLLRDGARSIEAGLIGVEVMELASRDTNSPPETSLRKLLVARFDLINKLRDTGHAETSTAVFRAYRDSDAWMGLIDRQIADERHDELSLVSAITPTFPGAMAFVAVLGALVSLVGQFVEKYPILQTPFRRKFAPFTGLAAGMIVYILIGLTLPALLAVACFACYVYEPKVARRAVPTYLGPLFRFALFVFGMLFAIFGFAWVFGLTTPAVELLPLTVGSFEIERTSAVAFGMMCLTVGLSLLLGPAWGVAQRFSPPRLAGLTLRELGQGIAVTCLILAVLGGPAAWFVDRYAHDRLKELAENEPLYYLTQWTQAS